MFGPRHEHRLGQMLRETAKMKKGSRVLIEGRLTPDKASGGPRIWQKQDGTSAASYEVTAQTVRFLTTRGESEGGAAPGDAGDMTVAPAEDDIPF